MIKIVEKKDCCGCTACASICPHNSITMKPDVMGFLYPVVDMTSCVECGLCEKVCQFHDDYKRYGNYNVPEVYGCRHKDPEELSHSQSGAAAWAITQTFLESPGVVYGVGYESVTHIVHKRATSLDECQEFRGSKYVQSDLRGVFRQVKNDLKEGYRVLFFGTACQVSGLKSYIPVSLHERLFIVDIVCHATPSPAFWKSYVEYMQCKYKSEIVKVDFRDQVFGWHSHEESFYFANGKKVSSHIFRTLFYDHLIIRDSCLNCPFTNLKRISDITLSDFWGWEKHYQEWHDNKGVSLFLINSDKGRLLYQQSQIYLSFIRSDMEKCLQPQLQHPAEEPHDFYSIPQLFKKDGFIGVARKYGLIPGRKYYIDKFKSFIQKMHLLLSRIKHAII